MKAFSCACLQVRNNFSASETGFLVCSFTQESALSVSIYIALKCHELVLSMCGLANVHSAKRNVMPC